MSSLLLVHENNKDLFSSTKSKEKGSLSMEKLFPTGNQMIDPRICYESGFMHEQRPSQSVNEPAS